MKYTCHHVAKWLYANLDLAEEQLEKQKKALIVIGGASSSGKSFLSISLKKAFERDGKRCLTFSLDQYNFGLSGIIPNKVNEHYFSGSLKNIGEMRSRIYDVIFDIPFDQKYTDESCIKIKEAVRDLFSDEETLNTFISGLKEEWSHLNFDEPSVYNLEEAAQDVIKMFNGEKVDVKTYSKINSERLPSSSFFDGNDYDVIIVEGIYALSSNFLDIVSSLNPVTNFIEGNPKTLFLRRILRDKKGTSASTAFTIDMYFKYILDSYYKTILPCKERAGIVLENDFSFNELREGELFTSRDTFPANNVKAIASLKKNSTIQEVSYQKDFYFTVNDEKENERNLLRFRERSLDGGKTYIPGSLVHKGAPKFRNDGKIIRPINVLLDEKEIFDVWKNNDDVLFAFLSNGFEIAKAEEKIKTRITYKGQEFAIYEVRGKGAYLEIGQLKNPNSIKEVKELVK